MTEFVRQLISEPVYFIIFFTILSLVIYFFLVKKFPLTKIQWKYVDFIWLALTSAGIFGILEKNRVLFRESDYSAATYEAKGTAQILRNLMTIQWMCVPLALGSNSPKDFYQVEKQRELTCNWLRKTFEMVKVHLDSLEKIDTTAIPVIIMTDQFYLEAKYDILKYIKQYNIELQKRDSFFKLVQRSDLVSLLEFLSPIFLCFGLSIRLIKTIGEIKLEKKT